MTIHWKTVEQYFTVVLFVSQFYALCYFGKFASFGLGAVRSGNANHVVNHLIFKARKKSFINCTCQRQRQTILLSGEQGVGVLFMWSI